MDGHTNSSEFEADKYAANRVGTQIFVKTLKQLLKETIKAEKKKYQKKIHDITVEFNVTGKSPTDRQKYDDNIKSATENYRNIVKIHTIDVNQRIQVLTDIDILMNDKFRNVY